MNLQNKKIFIFGATGTIGQELAQKYVYDNIVINYSRCEKKHWELDSKLKSKNLSHIIGDIINYTNVEQSLIRENPDLIIITSALKHIDRCEYAIGETLNTNVLGIKNIVDAVENNLDKLIKLDSVIFISTDKACNPVSVYGLSKSMAEKIMVEKSKFVKSVKFITARFGNILNSSGSIIPILHMMGGDPSIKYFTLTHKLMNRFVISIENAIRLIDYCIASGSTGDIIVPKLKSIKINDLMEIFSKIYNKPITVTGLRSGERIYESMVNDTEAMRSIFLDDYIIIKAQYLNTTLNENAEEYSSKQDGAILSKIELENYLKTLNII
ncbi:MAG: putative dTDP-d-glucose 4 6-dehydratase [Hyperionvirus sp.]|uniref:Putative dTDP-d-glucose 4 6-dehydratase n=1 Tax=Hyperionvirus sp. TaxID=2487770 RepID=A0A3G5A892_9VIRU|nr:MAG: putative dTDP-d-glucose 4 6-dehydratase [Hyperionvirus sp.]